MLFVRHFKFKLFKTTHNVQVKAVKNHIHPLFEHTDILMRDNLYEKQEEDRACLMQSIKQVNV